MKLRASPLSRLVTLISAPDTRAPAGSVTTPAMLPVGVWARTEPTATNRATKRLDLILLTIVISTAALPPHSVERLRLSRTGRPLFHEAAPRHELAPIQSY